MALRYEFEVLVALTQLLFWVKIVIIKTHVRVTSVNPGGSVNLNKLSNNSLVRNTKELVKKELHLSSEILDHLQEIQDRKLYASLSYSSLFEFCVRELRYSESAAYQKISAVRIIKELPEIKVKLNSGCLTLTTVTQVQSFFRKQNKVNQQKYSTEEKRAIISSLENKSKKQVEKILVQLSPSAMIPHDRERDLTESHIEIRFVASQELKSKLDQIRSLKSHALPVGDYNELFLKMADHILNQIDPSLKKSRRKNNSIKGCPSKQNSSVNKVSESNPLENMASEDCHYEDKVAEKKIAENKITERKIVESKITERKIAENKLTEKKVPERKVVESKITKMKSTEKKEPENKSTERNRSKSKVLKNNLLKNNFPKDNLLENNLPGNKASSEGKQPKLKITQTFPAAAKLGVKNTLLTKVSDCLSVEPKNSSQVLDVANNSRCVSAVSKNPRYVSAALRQKVWLRDEGRCCFKNSRIGKTCESKKYLQVDHIKPIALGGKSQLSNLRLLCKEHNLLLAAQIFGEFNMKSAK